MLSARGFARGFGCGFARCVVVSFVVWFVWFVCGVGSRRVGRRPVGSCVAARGSGVRARGSRYSAGYGGPSANN